MKRVLLLTAGALGAAGMIAMAAPASAAPANPVDSVTQFRQNLEKQSGTFRDSIKPDNVVNEFLYGNCGADLADCPNPPEVSRPGVLTQFDFFRRDLQSQSETFGNSIDPTKQLKTFADSVTDPSSSGKGE